MRRVDVGLACPRSRQILLVQREWRYWLQGIAEGCRTPRLQKMALLCQWRWAICPGSASGRGAPTPGSLNRLTHEYEVKDDLDDAWAARPLGLVRERGQTILVLKDPGGEPLGRLIGPRMELEHS